MDLIQMHRALSASRPDALTEPATLVEGLGGASCEPHLKHLAQLAATAATSVDTAEACMRGSGLWPWQR